MDRRSQEMMKRHCRIDWQIQLLIKSGFCAADDTSRCFQPLCPQVVLSRQPPPCPLITRSMSSRSDSISCTRTRIVRCLGKRQAQTLCLISGLREAAASSLSSVLLKRHQMCISRSH